METQLPTPKKSNNYSITKEKLFDSLKDNLNYISIGLMLVANILISLLKVEDGEIGVNTPTTPMGWVLWASRIILSTLIGVIILNFFRRQGIKLGIKKIEDVYKSYLEALQKHSKGKKPRSIKQYLTSKGVKDSISKSLIFIATSLIATTLLISANWNNFLSLIATTVISIAFGIKALLEAEEYVIEEGVVWFSQKTEELKKEDKENDNINLLRGNECSLGPSEPSGVQQKEECNSGLTDSNINNSSK